MRFCTPLVVVSLMVPCVSSWAQSSANTPKPGSAERRAIADALRVPVKAKLKQKVIFKIDRLKVVNGWAFLQGVPQQPNGKPVNYKGTPYQEAIDAGAFDDSVVALLRKREGKWRVVTYVLGATDVPYVDWDTRYGAPRAILPIP